MASVRSRSRSSSALVPWPAGGLPRGVPVFPKREHNPGHLTRGADWSQRRAGSRVEVDVSGDARGEHLADVRLGRFEVGEDLRQRSAWVRDSGRHGAVGPTRVDALAPEVWPDEGHRCVGVVEEGGGQPVSGRVRHDRAPWISFPSPARSVVTITRLPNVSGMSEDYRVE